MLRFLGALFLIMFASTTARAATITWSTHLQAYVVSGLLMPGDGRMFREATGKDKHAVIYFDGPGGNLSAGIEIGRFIRFKHFQTAIADGATCASACAFAWLAGSPRYMGDKSHVGFHGASQMIDGQRQDTSGGNALIGAYLCEIGLIDENIYLLTSTPYSSVAWLSRGTLNDAGIPSLNVNQAPFTPPPTEIRGLKVARITGIGTATAAMNLQTFQGSRTVSANCRSGEMQDIHGETMQFSWLTRGAYAPRFIANNETVSVEGQPAFEEARARLAVLCPGYGRIIP